MMSRVEHGEGAARGDFLRRASLVGTLTAVAIMGPINPADTDRADSADFGSVPAYMEASTTTDLSASTTMVSKLAVKAAAGIKADNKRARGPCTSIRRGKDELYLGKACRANAKAATVDNGYPDQEWSYSAVLVGGVYKCGYIRRGVLRKATIRSDVMEYCSDAYEPLTEKRFSVYRSINCPRILGMEGCRDGAPGQKLVAKRCGRAALYENFATNKRSVFNVRGTGKGGFSGPITEKKNDVETVRWRANTKLGSKKGRAAMVRGVDTDWGFVKEKCISKDTKRSIGTITEFTPEQIDRIKQNQREWMKLKRLRIEREQHISEQERTQ